MNSLPKIPNSFTQHYMQVVAVQPYTSDRLEALQHCKEVVPSCISPFLQFECSKVLSLKEMEGALSQMANGKAPWLDGFPYEFYKSCWECVGPYLHKFYLNALHARYLDNLINKGNIKFIPK